MGRPQRSTARRIRRRRDGIEQTGNAWSSVDADGQWTWNTEAVPAGTYNILSIIDDGRNATLRYSTGPVEVISDLIFSGGFE